MPDPQELPMEDQGQTTVAPVTTSVDTPKTKKSHDATVAADKKEAGKAMEGAAKGMSSAAAGAYKAAPGPGMSAMGEPLGNYKKGTNYVPKTGNYKLHEGEAVIPKEDNDVAGALGEKKSTPKAPKHIVKSSAKKTEKPTVHHMSIHKVSGGHIVHHHNQPHEEGDGRKPDSTHVVPDGPGGDGDISNLQAHMQDHMGADPTQAGAPDPTAGAGAPTAGVAPLGAPAAV